MEETRPSMSKGPALTEAMVIQEIAEKRFNTKNSRLLTDLAGIVIEKRVNEKFRDQMGETAELDIHAQAYEVLDEKMPELTKAMRREVLGKARVASYLMPKYMSFLDEKHYISYQKRAQLAATATEEQKAKAWESARKTADDIIEIVAGTIASRHPKSKKSAGEFDMAFGQVFESELEEGKWLNRQDQALGPDLKQAVLAYRDAKSIWETSTNEIVKIIQEGVNVNQSYQKQKLFNKNTSEDSK